MAEKYPTAEQHRKLRRNLHICDAVRASDDGSRCERFVYDAGVDTDWRAYDETQDWIHVIYCPWCGERLPK